MMSIYTPGCTESQISQPLQEKKAIHFGNAPAYKCTMSPGFLSLLHLPDNSVVKHFQVGEVMDSISSCVIPMT